MAKRGRKPKPTALKKLEGNPGKRQMNEYEPLPPIALTWAMTACTNAMRSFVAMRDMIFDTSAAVPWIASCAAIACMATVPR